MKILYLKLENVAGIIVGQQRNSLEIDFTRSRHKIISIQGKNGVGKTILISSLTPFSSVTSLDERSTLPYIVPGKNGYKEIHYQLDDSTYTIKHYYKPNKDGGHGVKSYFVKDGEELNENGNVGSFLSLVEIHFGLTQEMMRLLRLGSNVNSFVTLRPAERKNYVGRLIEEIDLYLKVHRKINDDLRVVKTLMSSNATNLQNCHITDIIVESDKLTSLLAKIKKHERNRDDYRLRISKIESLERENNIDELRRKRKEAEASLFSLNQMENEIESEGLMGISVSSLMKIHSELMDRQATARGQVNSYRLSVDTNLSTMDRLQTKVKQLTSNGDMESLVVMISELKMLIGMTDDIIKSFNYNGCKSDDVSYMISKLSAFNQLSSMIHTFGEKPTSVYMQLRQKGINVDKFITEQTKRRLSTVSDIELKKLLSQVFQDDSIISPNCTDQFHDCPYYRFAGMINDYRSRTFDDTLDDDIIRYVKVISTNIDAMLNEIDYLMGLPVPDGFKDIMKEQTFLGRLEGKLPFFDLSELEGYLSRLRANEIYRDQLSRLAGAEHELSIYKSSGADHYLSEIETLRSGVERLKNDIVVAEEELLKLQLTIKKTESNIGLLTRYDDGQKYRSLMKSTLETTSKILVPLENAEAEKRELQYYLDGEKREISVLSGESRLLEQQIDNYNRLVKEGNKLRHLHDRLTMIATSVSTKKGIPIVYMNVYLGKIQRLANQLLSIIYDGELVIGKFKVTDDEFEIPYIKNGVEIPDIRYASQSEVPLITMALSFALAHGVNKQYNIPLLDEIDAGLDDTNRSAFLKMLDRQLKEFNSEQAIMISHNISQMINLPMDVIKLSETNIQSKLQNIIYE